MPFTLNESRELAWELLQETPVRWRHVQSVARLAESWADEDLVPEVVVKAAWLHDIGYAKPLVRTGMHALDGANYLELYGVEVETVALVAHHTGAWVEAEERGISDRLLAFASPKDENLDALTLADLVSGPQGGRVTVSERLAEILSRYEEQHPVHRAVVRSAPSLQTTAARAALRLSQPM